jgi:hypothetical protein
MGCEGLSSGGSRSTTTRPGGRGVPHGESPHDETGGRVSGRDRPAAIAPADMRCRDAVLARDAGIEGYRQGRNTVWVHRIPMGLGRGLCGLLFSLHWEPSTGVDQGSSGPETLLSGTVIKALLQVVPEKVAAGIGNLCVIAFSGIGAETHWVHMESARASTLRDTVYMAWTAPTPCMPISV